MAGDLTFRLDPRRLADENPRVSGGVQGGEARSLGRRARAADWPGGALAGRPVSTVLSFVVVVVVVIVAVFFLMFEMRILA